MPLTEFNRNLKTGFREIYNKLPVFTEKYWRLSLLLPIRNIFFIAEFFNGRNSVWKVRIMKRLIMQRSERTLFTET